MKIKTVNGLGIMGGGSAKQFRNKYPHVYKRYRRYAKSHDNLTDLLGLNLMIAPNGENSLLKVTGALHE